MVRTCNLTLHDFGEIAHRLSSVHLSVVADAQSFLSYKFYEKKNKESESLAAICFGCRLFFFTVSSKKFDSMKQLVIKRVQKFGLRSAIFEYITKEFGRKSLSQLKDDFVLMKLLPDKKEVVTSKFH